MIGRKAIGNPNIFSEILGNKTKFTFKDYLALAKEYKLKFREIKFQAIWFTKGMIGGAPIRNKLARAKTLKEIKQIIS